jgi:glycosyltransferase involved in cell wall biosynthesis
MCDNQSMDSSLKILIPVYNEEKTIIKILERISISCEQIKNYEVIVVDDGSTDETNTQLLSHSNLYSLLLTLPQNRGKGYAIIKGLENVKQGFVLIQDADLEYDPSEIPFLWNEIKKNSAEVLLTSRLSGSKTTRVHYFWHKVGNRIITLFFNICNNTTFTDIYSGYLIFDVSKINLSKLRFFGWGQQAEILTYLIKNSTKIYETPISYYGRTYEEGKKIRFTSVFKVFMAIIITRFRP